MTNSVINKLMGQSSSPQEIVVGLGATRLGYTDRHPCTIVEVVKNGKGDVVAVKVQQDRATRTDNNGLSESQTYEYTPNPNASIVTYTRRKDGGFVREGSPFKGGERILIGHREKYSDPSY